MCDVDSLDCRIVSATHFYLMTMPGRPKWAARRLQVPKGRQNVPESSTFSRARAGACSTPETELFPWAHDLGIKILPVLLINSNRMGQKNSRFRYRHSDIVLIYHLYALWVGLHPFNQMSTVGETGLGSGWRARWNHKDIQNGSLYLTSDTFYIKNCLL